MEHTEIVRILERCERRLYGHRRGAMSPHNVLAELAAMVGPEDQPDGYGHGKLIEEFEAHVAQLLGKEAAVFMPSGTMCQQIALRIHAERRKCFTVAFHPKCHLEIHEEQAYRRLHALNSVLVGPPERMLTLGDLQGIREPIAALLLELPQREIGGQLPAWDDLNAQIAWAREQGAATHLDGARLWESQPFYDRSYAEICALFDTVYVSFYKVLGGIAGAILAGPSDIIRESRLWQRRHGGNLVQMYPYVLSAKRGLETRLDRMAAYYAQARKVADVVRSIPGIKVMPDPPQTNMMHLFFHGDKSAWEDAALRVADETGIFLFGGPGRLHPTAVPGWFRWELSTGDAALDLTDEEIEFLFRRLSEIVSEPQAESVTYTL